jgi:hypothetical protein
MATPEERERRASAFALVRRRHTQEDAALTPEQRLAITDELIRFWKAPDVPGESRPTDEPMTLWRELRRRLRGER